jgi:hypothetical protein
MLLFGLDAGYEAASNWPQEHNVHCRLWLNGMRCFKYIYDSLVVVTFILCFGLTKEEVKMEGMAGGAQHSFAELLQWPSLNCSNGAWVR